MRREERHRTALGNVSEALQHARDGVNVAWVVRLRHVGRQAEQGGVPVIERRAEADLAGLLDAEPRADVREAARDGERRAREDDGRLRREQLLVQARGDVERRAVQREVVAAPHPVDGVGVRLGDEAAYLLPRLGLVDHPLGEFTLQLLQHGRGLGRQALHLAQQDVGAFAGLGGAALEAVPRDVERGPRGLRSLRGRDAYLALVGLALLRRELRESRRELRPLVAHLVERQLRLVLPELGALLARLLDSARADDRPEAMDHGAEPLDEVLDRRLRDAEAELPRRLGLEVVRLVDDEVVVVGQQRAADLEVGEQQRVVDDEQVRGGRLVAGVAVETCALPCAGADREPARAHAVPREEFRAGQPQLRAVAGACLAEPRERLRQRAGVVGRRHVAVRRRLPASQAEVVRLPLELGVPEVGDVQPWNAVQHVQQVRDVLRDQLLLQVDGIGGDDDAHVVAQCEQHGGEQVGDGLADAGAAFHEQVVRLRVRVRRAERPRDGFRHLRLLASRLVAAEALRERAVVRQQLAHFVRRHRFRRLRHAEAARTLQPPRDLLRVDAADGPGTPGSG